MTGRVEWEGKVLVVVSVREYIFHLELIEHTDTKLFVKVAVLLFKILFRSSGSAVVFCDCRLFGW